MPLQQLRRIRWAVRATLLFGVAASVAANVLHALPNPISQGIAAWPPLALLLAVELISRIPMHRRALAFARLASTAAIACIAAWVSYWHMVGVVARYGETQTTAYLLPLSVDGLIVVASVSLVELAGRIRVNEQQLEARRLAAAPPAPAPAWQPAPAPAPAWVPAPAPTMPPVPTTAPAPRPVPVAPPQPAPEAPAVVSVPSQTPVAALGPFAPAAPLVELPDLPVPVSPAIGTTGPLELRDFAWTADTAALTTAARRSTPQVVQAPKPTSNAVSRKAVNKAVGRAEVPKQRRSVAETAALVAEIQADEPTISLSDLAERLGISVSRLRAVRREAAQLEQAAA